VGLRSAAPKRQWRGLIPAWGKAHRRQATRRPICPAFALPLQTAADEVAKRLECEELAPAFVRAQPS